MRKAFYYKNYEFNAKTGQLAFQYESMGHHFEETIIFHGAPFDINDRQKKVLDLVLFYAHIAFGISYYKAFLNHEIIIESGTLTETEAAFFTRFYLKGLGEFSVKNNVDISIAFPSEPMRREKIDLNLTNRALVPVGGGKDSCVTMELLKQARIDICAVSVGNPRPIKECVQVAHIPHITVHRQLSQELLDLNSEGTVLNGHVPITGMFSFLLWAAAILYDYKYVAMSCERSANSGNTTKNGLMVNHQYSKSLDYEQDFNELTRSVTPEFLYFSLLRPYSEAHIAKLFANQCASYFDVFTSCNKAFKLDASKRLERWCGSCDKCRFVFLILAPFMEKEKLVSLVGANPLNDISQLNGYEELLGLNGHKPFECVGEVAECRWAFATLAKNPKWADEVVIRKLSKKIELIESDIFIPSPNHFIPKEFEHALL